MKLLLINYEYPPVGGGAANAMWNIARELVKQTHQVTILTANYKELRGWKEEQEIRVYRCRAWRRSAHRSTLLEQLSFVMSALFVLPKILRNCQIEAIIIYFSMPCGPIGLWGKMLFNKPYVISLRGGDVPGIDARVSKLHRLLMPVRRAVLKHSYAIVANSIGLKQLAELADPYPVKIIPNGVDTEFFYQKIHQNDIFNFLFVGRFQPQKNLFFLLEQLSQLKKSVTIPFICHLIGDGQLKAALQEYAVKLQLDSILSWHGWLDKEQLRKIYQGTDCFLNLSRYEGMPNVVLEAMACGLPVIASQVIGNTEVVRSGITGYLVDLQKPQDIQQALCTLLTHREQAARFGQAGREWVIKEFSWTKVASEYVNLFSEPKMR
ncbi:MAG: glycosyltransferase family 4 protein [Thioploca sp.]|nr:glycosyltransferase family 4 protein [Thioploca sp.]